MQPNAFSFVQTNNPEALTAAIVFVNRRRRIPIYYERIIQTTPRRGWIALILDGSLIDQYLLRALSTRLQTTTFGISLYGVSLSYRLHTNGQTKAAYESHLALIITDRLRKLLASGATHELDLAEPAERLILQRYHEYQHSRAWTQPSARESIPDEVLKYYSGNITELKNILKPGVDPQFVGELLEPGYSPEMGLHRILESLAFPYLSEDEVIVAQKIENESPMLNQIQGAAILNPQLWKSVDSLPKGWYAVLPEKWAVTS